MIKDISPSRSSTVSSGDIFKTVIEVRDSIAPDHLIDSLARAYALEVRLGVVLRSLPNKAVQQKLTRVNYG